MDLPPVAPNLLRLIGVSVARDYKTVEDLADARWREEGSAAAEAVAGEAEPSYCKIPRKFESVEDWPDSTDLLCWQCDRGFDTPPCFVPNSAYEDKHGRMVFDVVGNFCTWNCAALWIRINYNDSRQWRVLDNLRFAYFAFTGIHPVDIPPAYPKTNLAAYGGHWSAEEFNANMADLDPHRVVKVARRAHTAVEAAPASPPLDDTHAGGAPADPPVNDGVDLDKYLDELYLELLDDPLPDVPPDAPPAVALQAPQAVPLPQAVPPPASALPLPSKKPRAPRAAKKGLDKV